MIFFSRQIHIYHHLAKLTPCRACMKIILGMAINTETKVQFFHYVPPHTFLTSTVIG
jgi:hypothetical protein